MKDDIKKVAFVTGSRADYGIVRRYLQLLCQEKDIRLSVLATGALLDKRYGHAIETIYQDGFLIDCEINICIDPSSNLGVIKSMSIGLQKFGEFFSTNHYDLLILLGDRYEMLVVAIAAAMQKVPILHLHGGEATFGNYDEFIRHSITKMSRYHFTSTEEYRRRVIQLGEDPNAVFNLGALGAENCYFLDENKVLFEIKSLPSKKYFVVLFHPETLTCVKVEDQIKNILEAINCYEEYGFVFIGSNADTSSDIINQKVINYVQKHSNMKFYTNMNTDSYHYLLKNSIALIGNSSSGLIEAPTLGIYTINIGDRQKGRVRGNSVRDVICDKADIKNAIFYTLTNELTELFNPYYKANAALMYCEKTMEILKNVVQDIKEPKKFYDCSDLENLYGENFRYL